jgi:hypothetical protein
VIKAAIYLLLSYRGREEALKLVPPVITLGIGCKKGVTTESIERAYDLMLKKSSCHPLSIARVCSIDLKERTEYFGVLPYTLTALQYILGARTDGGSGIFRIRVCKTGNGCGQCLRAQRGSWQRRRRALLTVKMRECVTMASLSRHIQSALKRKQNMKKLYVVGIGRVTKKYDKCLS